MRKTPKITAPENTVAIYARFSTENQKEDSITAQVEACEDFAAKNSYLVVATFADYAKTGTTDERPELQKLMGAAKQHSFRYVLVHKSDRLFRNHRQALNYEFELNLCGVEIISVTENFGNTMSGQMFKNFKLIMDEYYSKNLKTEVKKV
jgi:site-specific DNA recombinase